MADPEHLSKLKEGTVVWNRWREAHPDVEPDLRRADLRGLDLSGADLFQSDLSLADLSRADLKGAEFGGADLGAADLGRADLSGADLVGANLRGASLGEARVGGALVGHTIFASVDLSATEGLDTVTHVGPSPIGIDTIQLSKGLIPEAFLRGAGVPEPFITNMHALLGAMEPIQFYSCFISYSAHGEDDEFAHRLYADLQAKAVRSWFAPEDLKIGDKFRSRIDESIRMHDRLLVVLSERSINSAWVEKEVEAAFEEERRRKTTVLFPVRLDNAVMDTNQSWAADIRSTRHIGDFANWKNHDSYQKGFDRLLRDLQAEAVRAAKGKP
jgi:hypothetical protein